MVFAFCCPESYTLNCCVYAIVWVYILCMYVCICMCGVVICASCMPVMSTQDPFELL